MSMKISIESNIGGGKSTLLSRIQRETRIPVFLEALPSWTTIDLFYQDPKRWGLTFNIEVLMSMMKWKYNEFMSLYERSPLSCLEVFTQLQADEGAMTEGEMNIFLKLYQHFGWNQDCVIYIDTVPEVCYERMKSRNRGCESNVTLEYLQKVHMKHTSMVSRLRHENVRTLIFVVNGNQEPDDVYKDVLGIISKLQCKISHLASGDLLTHGNFQPVRSKVEK